MKRDAFKELVAANDAIGIAIIVFKLKVFKRPLQYPELGIV
jgi:hypothetical protein